MEEKILYFDCLSGISGDMTIGALLDLGVDKDKFLKELEKIKIDGYKLEIKRAQKNGITGTDFKVILEADHSHDHDHHHEHKDSHNHENSHHSHEHDHTHDHNHEHNHNHNSHSHHSHEGSGHSHDHHHRNLHDIEKIIDDSELGERVKALSKKIFSYVAHAEAKIHDKPLNEVHFHEVGAVDSIVDIIGAAICIDMLKVDKIYSSPLHTGTGFVKCAHGRIPVPAPATLEILKGIPIYSTGVRSELVTPTGAAIIKALATDFIPLPEMIIENVGYGLGKKDLEITNVLRVSLGKKKLRRH